MNTEPAELDLLPAELDEAPASLPRQDRDADADTGEWVCQCACNNPGVVHP